MNNKEKENAGLLIEQAAGYLNGWFKDPHAHVALPCHEAEEDTPAEHGVKCCGHT